MYWLIVFTAGSIAGPLAYYIRVQAGQSKRHAFVQALLTAFVPWLFIQDVIQVLRAIRRTNEME